MHSTPLELAPPGVPDARTVMNRTGGENFPVALRVLGKSEREQLLAIYGFARLVDQLGDELPAESAGPSPSESAARLAALDWLEGELDRAYRGEARHPLMRRLGAAIDAHPLPRAPFERLIEANRTDQRVHRYDTFEQLLSYCDLSANPVGELVLAVFDSRTPERVERSNDICTALQLAEHWQDVAEDHRRGRVYIPAEDLSRFGVDPERLVSPDPQHRARMRALIGFEVARARELLRSGEPLLRTLAGRPRLAVTGFWAGGSAALDAIEQSGCEVLDGAPRASRARRAATFAAALAATSLRRRGRRR